MPVTRRNFTFGASALVLAGCGGDATVLDANTAQRDPAFLPQPNASYDSWVAAFKKRAAARGITNATLTAAFRNQGYLPGVIEREDGSLLISGSLSADALGDRLLALHIALSAIFAEHAPDTAAVEQTFVNKDGAGTLKLGQARGIAMLVPAQAGLSVGEYAPNAVKKAVVGVGHADKKQIDHMVRLQLPGVEIAGPDAADALAIAICHAHHAQSASRLTQALARASA